MKNTIKNHKALFFVFFVVLGYILRQVPVSALVGADVSFTLFDLFAPIAGSFLGLPLGIASVLTTSSIALLTQDSVNMGSIIRLFPTLFAVAYFGQDPQKRQNNKYLLVVPVVAISAFLAHPEGRAAWYFSLFWLIPLAAYKYRTNLFLRSLGATFTAHSVGGAAWAWAFNLSASTWTALIPVVAIERTLFAGGVAASFLLCSHGLRYLQNHKILPAGLHFEKPSLVR